MLARSLAARNWTKGQCFEPGTRSTCTVFLSREYCLPLNSLYNSQSACLVCRRCTRYRSKLIQLMVLCASLCCTGFFSGTVQAASASAPHSAQTAQAAAASTPVTRYTLPPDKLRQAVALARTGRRLYFLEFFSGLLALLVILRVGWAAKLRDWATRATSRSYLQALLFCPPLVFTLDLVRFPFHIWGHAVLRGYGLSVQGWGSWFLDWLKAEAITLLLATLAGWVLYLLIRRSPRRWWTGAWAAAVLLLIAGVYVEPLVIEPLFYDFHPLSETHPQLVHDVEQTIARVGVSIPEDRILEMRASSKVNELNAYVSGIGSTKRIVFWDTLFTSMNEPQTLSVFGHELGHYVFGHAWKGILLSAIGLGISLPILAWFFAGVLRKWESLWYVRAPQDWTSLAVLLLLISVFQFVATPVDNAVSRYIEHQADVFGLEVIHGVVPDSPQVAAQAFQILGEANLEEPDPSPYVVFWFYTHPPIADRIGFALAYYPWSQGASPEFIH
jgi:STE24 endopeptidase